MRIIGNVDVEIRHLQLVRAVARAGNLTRAGAALHLTQSALSHQLRDIESRLGTSLFLRVGKRMLLTRAGEELLQSAEEVLATIERTETTIRQLADTDGGLLRISTECYTCYHWLPALLKRYRRSHPYVDVQIDTTATSAPITSLVDGHLDVAIVSDRVRDRRVVVQPLFDDELVVIMEPQHRLRSRPFISVGDFAGETLLTYSPKEDSTVHQWTVTAGGRDAARLSAGAADRSSSVELVKAGLGVAALARLGRRATPPSRNVLLRSPAHAARAKEYVECGDPQGSRPPATRATVDRPARRASAVCRGPPYGGDPPAPTRHSLTLKDRLRGASDLGYRSPGRFSVR